MPTKGKFAFFEKRVFNRSCKARLFHECTILPYCCYFIGNALKRYYLWRPIRYLWGHEYRNEKKLYRVAILAFMPLEFSTPRILYFFGPENYLYKSTFSSRFSTHTEVARAQGKRKCLKPAPSASVSFCRYCILSLNCLRVSAPTQHTFRIGKCD